MTGKNSAIDINAAVYPSETTARDQPNSSPIGLTKTLNVIVKMTPLLVVAARKEPNTVNQPLRFIGNAHLRMESSNSNINSLGVLRM